ncbi:hypothetical protein [Phycicoccus avicenniae]|uniref:hypothetical protein n=1 Tax=Phycicoccus avicenniae TaxID=2828860 RepID=UPI003D2C57D0
MGEESRSVGELLTACDLSARQMLLEPEHLAAAELLRSWPELVQAGQELLAATRVSSASGSTILERADEVAERIRLIGDGLHAQLERRGWPGPGPGDPRMVALSDVFVGVHDRVERRWRRAQAGRIDVAADAAALRARVMHTLYIATHAVLLAVRQESTEARLRPRGLTRVQTRRLAAMRYCDGRLETAERMLAVPVYRVFPSALTGQHTEKPHPDRLAAALGLWELEAHRAMAREPHLGTLMEVSRVQAASVAMTRAVLVALCTGDEDDRTSPASVVDEPLASAAGAWQSLHADVRDVTHLADRVTRLELAAAGAELVAAFSEVLTTGTENASIRMIRRATGEDTAAALLGSLTSQVDLATVVVDILAGEPLGVTARTARQFARRFEVDALGTALQAMVTPQDLAADRTVPLPPEIRDALIHRAAHVRRVAAFVSSIPFVHRPVGETPQRHVRDGQTLHHREPDRLVAGGLSR